MKIKLLLIGVLSFTSGMTVLSQSNTRGIQLENVAPSRALHRSLLNYDDQSRAAVCVDTIHYPLVKEQLVGAGNFFTFGLWQEDNEAISQTFLGTAGMQITGVEIFGRHNGAGGASNTTVRASIYVVDGSNNPTGTALTSGTVTISSTVEDFYGITFGAPATVSGNYAVVLDVINAGGLYISFFNNAATGQVYDENLARFKSDYPDYGSGGNWIPTTSIQGLGQIVDFEPILAPVVSYNINTTGTVSPVSACLGDPITFTNTTNIPQLSNRMYNYQVFRQHFGLATTDSTFVWDLDWETDPLSPNDLVWAGNTSYTYAAGTYNPELISLGGFWRTCMDSAPFTVTINAIDDASFSYASSTICEGSANVTPASVATTGGTFSSTTGLVFADASTGEIDVAASTSGTYVITYTTAGACPDESTQTITITSAPDASFSYAATDYCTSGTNPSPTVTGTIGVFSSTPAGLVISSSTGVITLSTSTAGTYNVTNTIVASGACPAASETVQVTITEAGDASFAYAASSYCLSGSNPTPAVTGTAGTFSSTPAGLSINAATGEIDLANSTPGVYTVTNELPASGACPVITETAQVTVTANPDAAFSYAETSYCSTGTATPTITGAAGTFTASPAGLSINASTGVIDLAASTSGTYTVTNTIAATATCGEETETFTVTVEDVPTATVTLSGITLTAQETGVTYQWIDCAGNTPVAGATSQTFTPSVPGSYAVIITDGNCSATSSCQAVSNVGIEDNSIELIAVYPSPADHIITISGLTASNATVSILDVNGRILVSQQTASAKLEMSVRDFESGVYLIKVESETINGTKRFIRK